jgi:uncharacterized protein YggL (DUF469 family)
MRFGSGSATEADRAAVRDWLQARPAWNARWSVRWRTPGMRRPGDAHR